MSGFTRLPQIAQAQIQALPVAHAEAAVAPATHVAAEPAPRQAFVPAMLGGYSLAPHHDAANATATPAPTEAKTAAVTAEVRVNAVDAAVERKGAQAQVEHEASAIRGTAAQVTTDLANGTQDPNTQIEKKGKSVVETHVGADGQPDKITSVTTDKDGTVHVKTVVPGQSVSEQTVKTDQDGKTTVDEQSTTYKNGTDAHPDVATWHATTDGTTTEVDSKLMTGDDKYAEAKDTYTTQTGKKGIRDEVSEGFADDQATEVHSHSLTVSDSPADGATTTESTSYSQANHRVTKTNAGGEKSWTQEVQEGDDYHAVTQFEGDPTRRIQVSRHADEAAGTVTEKTAESNPVTGEVTSAASTTRGYDDDGRLTTSNTVDKEGKVTKTTSYSAEYTDNSDGTTTVKEETDAEVSEAGKPTRKTVQETDAVDTPQGRRVDHVHTEVAVDGASQLVADSDGKTTTIEGPGAGDCRVTLKLNADGTSADQATEDLLVNSDVARVIAIAGMDATNAGARASAGGRPLLGAFADNRQSRDDNEGALLELHDTTGKDEKQGAQAYLDGIHGGGDAANALSALMASDAFRVGMEAKTAVTDALEVKSILQANAVNFDDNALAEMAAGAGKMSKLMGYAGIGIGAYNGVNDLRKALSTDDKLDQTDLVATGLGSLVGSGMGAASLFLDAGPPGWVVAAVALATQAAVTNIHDIDDDKRRGHPGEAEAEETAARFGILPALFLHQVFKHQDGDELHQVDLDAPVPETCTVDQG